MTLLNDRASSDPDSEIQQFAVREIARSRLYNPSALKWLLGLAGPGHYSAVRHVAIEELIAGWPLEASVLKLRNPNKK